MRMLPSALSVVKTLQNGGVGVMPTDTIYGIVGSALQSDTVRRIYALRRRDLKKPMIILIGGAGDLARFGIFSDAKTKKFLKRVWPGAVSVIMPLAPRQGVSRAVRSTARHSSSIARFKYLHRGTKALAFRLPKPAWLRVLLKKTGPLVAPSVNIEGRPPARTVREAKKYFSDKVDFYIDAGRHAAKPSTLVKVEKGGVAILRSGAVRIDRL
jgi:L-threonylcarbamoyladenylate synthase